MTSCKLMVIGQRVCGAAGRAEFELSLFEGTDGVGVVRWGCGQLTVC
jgi:hypothetical protein